MNRLCLLLLAGLGFMVFEAHAGDAHSWLQRMNQAARTLNYTGVFIYQSQGRTETSRITHMVDASGEHERLEIIDGLPREVVRHNEDVQCFLPQDKIVVTDRALAGRQPGRLMSKPGVLAEFYSIRLGEMTRIAGREAQQILLDPRDEMRYGHQLWVDVASGLLLKARTLNDQAGTVEQFAFSEVHPGGNIDHEKLRPRFSKSGDWRVVNARGQEIKPEDLGWSFRKLPPGFRNVSLVKRAVRKGGGSAIHAVFSDGLASVSVFIEPFTVSQPGSAQGSTENAGSTGIFRRMEGDRLVTVVGEVPSAALRRIAEGVERQPR